MPHRSFVRFFILLEMLISSKAIRILSFVMFRLIAVNTFCFHISLRWNPRNEHIWVSPEPNELCAHICLHSKQIFKNWINRPISNGDYSRLVDLIVFLWFFHIFSLFVWFSDILDVFFSLHLYWFDRTVQSLMLWICETDIM